MKQCSICGEVKPLADFYNSKSGKQGTTAHCKKCGAAKDRERYIKRRLNPNWVAKEQARQRDKQKRAYDADPDKLRARRRAYHANNRETSNQKAREYKQQNPEKIKELNLKWNHIDRAARKLRVPSWLTSEDRAMMTSVYREARRLGLHVDHIIPLQGKLVSGLHVPQNLQLLHPSENCSKKNTFEI